MWFHTFFQEWFQVSKFTWEEHVQSKHFSAISDRSDSYSSEYLTSESTPEQSKNHSKISSPYVIALY